MVLFSSLNVALTGLQSNMAALSTIGHNISNATTPGYSRQRVQTSPISSEMLTFGQVGRGVEVTRIRRLVDLSLESRLRDADSTFGSLSVRSDTLARLESLFQAMSDEDLGAMVGRFFESIDDLANNPDSISARSQMLENARSVTETMNYLAERIRESRDLINQEVSMAVDDINRLTSQLADLNRQVLHAENGGVDIQSANDLRDRRDLTLRELSEYMEIRAVETSTGEVNVLTGSAFLVFGQQAFALSTDDYVDDGVVISDPVFENGTATLHLEGGRLGGLLESRDEILKGALQDLNVMANAMIFEFNGVQATGQGLERFTRLESLHGITDPSAVLAIEGTVTSPVVQNTIVDSSLVGYPDLAGKRIMMFDGNAALESREIITFDPQTGTMVLDEAFIRDPDPGDRYQITELSFPVENGSFELVVTNELTGVQETHVIAVDLDRSLGAGPTITDDSYASIVAQLDAANGYVNAGLVSGNRLQMTSSSSEVTFSFANDTSGFLAAVGMNAFFDGVDAGSVEVNPDLLSNPERLSAAQSFSPGDNSNAVAFGNIRTTDVFGQSSLEELHQNLMGRIGVQASEIRNRYENQQLVRQQLENERGRVSGVDIDEEAVKMLEYQRAYQASARFITVVDSLLESLLGAV